jgi:hypothetical protein
VKGLQAPAWTQRTLRKDGEGTPLPRDTSAGLDEVPPSSSAFADGKMASGMKDCSNKGKRKGRLGKKRGIGETEGILEKEGVQGCRMVRSEEDGYIDARNGSRDDPDALPYVEPRRVSHNSICE